MRYSVALLIAALAIPAGRAQQQPTATEATAQPPLPVLHVYANLVQIPVLVLYPTHDKVATSITPDRFSLSFDRGPFVKATNARIEGDDPIDLAIVVDARGAQNNFLTDLDQAIANLAPAQLRPQDHVSLYVMTCGSIRSVLHVPVTDSARLKTAVDTALTDWTTRRVTKDKSPCSNSAPVMDLLAYATSGLAKAPGRRVILAFTNGDDKTSTHTWDFVSTLAQDLGVTIFALNADTGTTHFNSNHQSDVTNPTANFAGSKAGSSDSPVGPSAAYDPYDMVVSAFSAVNRLEPVFRLTDICELSGGVELRIDRNDPVPTLKRAVEMIRNRYVIDFPLPNETAGHHDLRVNIDREKFFIRPAGNGVHVSNPAQQPGPNTIQPGATPTPQLASAPAIQPSAPPAPQLAAALIEPSAPISASTPTLTPASTTPQRPLAPSITVDTKLTVVDITVTDKDGHPVHGLKQADFTIKEDGKTQPIKNFDAYGSSILPAQTASKLQPGLYANQAKPASGIAATNIILLDNVVMADVYADPAYFMDSKLEAQKYLKNLPPGTPVAVMDSADKLTMIQSVTTDRDALLAAINKVSFKIIQGVTLMPPHQFFPDYSLAERLASIQGQAELTLDALNQIATYASGIPGRKNLIWLTPGSPQLTNSARFEGQTGMTGLEVKMQQAYGNLAAAHVAIYAIDTHTIGFVAGTTTDTPDGISAGAAAAAFFNRQFEQESLRDFAEKTGGRAYYNRNDLDGAIADAVATGSDYYTVAYTPPLTGYDGKFHTIDVTVNRPGLQLTYRKGYTSLDLAKLNSSNKTR